MQMIKVPKFIKDKPHGLHFETQPGKFDILCKMMYNMLVTANRHMYHNERMIIWEIIFWVK